MLRRIKDYGMTVQAPLALVIGLELDASLLILITYLVADTLGATLAYYAANNKWQIMV
jgi:hypothetical protein